MTAVSAASGDGIFIVETQVNGNGTAAFYVFHLSSSGRPGALRRLPVSVPGGETTDAIALSPDADKLAIAVESEQEYGIEVYTLATGAVRIWMASRSTDTLLVGENTLSWTQDERTLSFPWGAGASAASSGARLLNLDARGGNLLTASRPAHLGIGYGWVCSGTPVITPDGKTLACGAGSSAESVANDQVVAGAAEYDAASGKLERVLGRHQSGPAGAILWWENTTGSVLIGAIQGPFDSCPMALPRTVGVFTGDRFVALPGMPEWFIGSFAW